MKKCSLRRFLLPVLLLACMAWADGARADLGDSKKSALSREKGAFYLEDVLDKEPKIKVTQEAFVYSTVTGANRLGSIPAGTTVSIIAISEKAYRVRGRARHDAVVGWVGKSNVQTLDPKFIAQLEAARSRQKEVDELIAKKIIALGMTPVEVESVLGKADERTSRLDATGTKEIFSYVTYKNVAQQVPQQDQNGQIHYTLVYVKVETGRQSIEFTNGSVSGIQETERDPRAGAQRFVPPPIIFEDF